MPATVSGYATLPHTVFDVKRLNCWKTMPMPRRSFRSSRSGRAWISRPSTETVPAVGRSSAFTSRTSVLLPAPE